jgi:hypothetical protein
LCFCKTLASEARKEIAGEIAAEFQVSITWACNLNQKVYGKIEKWLTWRMSHRQIHLSICLNPQIDAKGVNGANETLTYLSPP